MGDSSIIGKLEPQIVRMAEGRYAIWFDGQWWEMRPLPPLPTKPVVCSECLRPCGR